MPPSQPTDKECACVKWPTLITIKLTIVGMLLGVGAWAIEDVRDEQAQSEQEVKAVIQALDSKVDQKLDKVLWYLARQATNGDPR